MLAYELLIFFNYIVIIHKIHILNFKYINDILKEKEKKKTQHKQQPQKSAFKLPIGGNDNQNKKNTTRE